MEPASPFSHTILHTILYSTILLSRYSFLLFYFSYSDSILYLSTLPAITMTVLSSLFRSPYLDKPFTKPDMNIYASTTPETQALLLESYTTAGFAVIEPNGYLRFHASPVLIRSDENLVKSVVTNGSNLEFAPRSSAPEVFSHFVAIVSRRAIPCFALRSTAPLTEAHFVGSGMPYAPHKHLVALPRAFLIGFGKDWVEGPTRDPAVIDLFEHEYGPDAGAWLRIAKNSEDPIASAAANFIYTSALGEAGRLHQVLGDLVDNAMILPSSTTSAAMYVSAINETSDPDEYGALKNRLTPFFASLSPVYLPPPVAPTAAPPAGAVPDIDRLANAFISKEERRETSRLLEGFVKSMSVFMGGVVSFDDSTLLTLELPSPTRAYEEANARTSADTRTDAIKCLLDTNNKFRPVGGLVIAIAAARCMFFHEKQLCRQLMYGNWAEEPVTVLVDDTSNKTHISIYHFIPHTRDVVARAKRELEEGEVGEILNNTAAEKRINLLLANRIAGIDTIKQLIANVVSASDALWISSEEPEKRPIIARAFILVFDYLHEIDFLDYYNRSTRDDRDNITHHILSMMDRFVTRMVCAGNEYSTNMAIAAGNVGDIDISSYRRAVVAFSKDFLDVKETVDRGNKIKKCDNFAVEKPAGADLPAKADKVVLLFTEVARGTAASPAQTAGVVARLY